MLNDWNQTQLEKYISDQVEEQLTLEYKGADALSRTDHDKTEICKDVSALANSDGGVIVYGMAEYRDAARKHLPERIDHIDRREYSREWLEQIINNIRPRIDGIRIYPVPINSGPNDVVYVVEIPKGSTAHQATDKKYYKRFNFQSVPMEDYEIRDIMNRRQYPRIELSFAIVRKTKRVAPPREGIDLIGQRPSSGRPRIVTSYTLTILAKNTGNVFAQYANCFIEIPSGLLPNEAAERLGVSEKQGQQVCTIHRENTVRDVVDVQLVGLTTKNVYGPYRYVPILPGLSHPWEISLHREFVNKDYESAIVRWTTFADSALPTHGEIRLGDVKIVVVNME